MPNHKTLLCTPAMEAGITNHLWETGDIVDLPDTREIKKAA